MPEIPATTEELYRLYKQGWPLQRIAEEYNVSRQAIHWRFKSAGFVLRNTGGVKGRQRHAIDLELFRELYVNKGKFLYEIARILKMHPSTLKLYMNRDPKLRALKKGSTAWPQLNTLKIGESVLVPRSEKKNQNFARFYDLANRLGIRVSMSRDSENEMRITRVV